MGEADKLAATACKRVLDTRAVFIQLFLGEWPVSSIILFRLGVNCLTLISAILCWNKCVTLRSIYHCTGLSVKGVEKYQFNISNWMTCSFFSESGVTTRLVRLLKRTSVECVKETVQSVELWKEVLINLLDQVYNFTEWYLTDRQTDRQEVTDRKKFPVPTCPL